MTLIVSRPSTIPASAVVVNPVGNVQGADGQTAVSELANEKVNTGPALHNVPGLWRGTAAEYAAATDLVEGTVAFVLADAATLVASIYVVRAGGVVPLGQWNFSVANQSGHYLTVGF